MGNNIGIGKWRRQAAVSVALCSLILLSVCEKKPPIQLMSYWNPIASGKLGDSFLVSAGSKSPVLINKKIRFSDGDTILTNKSAKLRIQFNENDFFLIDESSVVVLHAKKQQNDLPHVRIELLKGKVYSDVKLLTQKGGSFGVLTPDTKITNEKTAYVVEYEPKKKKTKVAVMRGRVNIFHRKTKKTSAVKEGGMLFADPEKLFKLPAKLELKEFASMASWISESLIKMAEETKQIFAEYQKIERRIIKALRSSIKDTPDKVVRKENRAAKRKAAARRHETMYKTRDEPQMSREQKVAELAKSKMKDLERESHAADYPTRSPSAITSVLSIECRDLKYIYQRRMRRGKHFEGDLIVKFVILPTGTIESAEVFSSTLKKPEFEAEIIERFREIKFKEAPEEAGKLTIKYPLSFKGK